MKEEKGGEGRGISKLAYCSITPISEESPDDWLLLYACSITPIAFTGTYFAVDPESMQQGGRTRIARCT